MWSLPAIPVFLPVRIQAAGYVFSASKPGKRGPHDGSADGIPCETHPPPHYLMFICCICVSVKGAKQTQEPFGQAQMCKKAEGRLGLRSSACSSSGLVGVCTRALAVHFSCFSVGGVAEPSAVEPFGPPGSCGVFIHARAWAECKSADF